MDDLERRLTRLEDVRAVEQLKFRYTAACDFGYDLDALASCFAPDGRWVSDGFADCHGRDEIRDYFRRLAKVTPQALHYATSPRVLLDAGGGRAEARFHLLCLSTVRRRGSDEHDALVMIGSYHDRCIKIDGQWLFEELRADVRHISEWTQGWVREPWRR